MSLCRELDDLGRPRLHKSESIRAVLSTRSALAMRTSLSVAVVRAEEKINPLNFGSPISAAWSSWG
jgi:hypothetical protein